ncbi:type II toxin-antitoxin system VapB family antitoxin [Sphingomonas adhaesiva]|uniref:type II toxin-antitoxin system VapB family antitoxin n=1 Tax=Sphingomonas adhaesiva TaxID=28212 RepID=UPI002FFAE24F
MNAPPSPLSRAERQALSAPFLIEDEEVVRAIARLADERGTAMHEIVARAVEDYARRHSLATPAPDWLQRYWREHPLPLPTGLEADKRFYDSLNDEE